MPSRRRSSLGFRTPAAEALRRFIANQTRNNGHQRMNEENKEWLTCEQSDVQLNLKKRILRARHFGNF
ncbi:unnamed protein product, partial [Onchocerca ochengi]|uniref:Uncharacterized protein n=1 Tax=Onchocerca ochengi TaxID=42157 RepID=A0A182EDA9_ONCOC